jgi:hypothetical protein
MAFDTDAGILSWINLPSATTTAGIALSYSAQHSASSTLTVYAETTTTLGNITNQRVGIATTTPFTTFSVDGEIAATLRGAATSNGICHSGDNIDASSPEGVVFVACTGTVGDIAEWYETDTGVEEGDIVMATFETISFDSDRIDAMSGKLEEGTTRHSVSVMAKATTSDKIIGVVSSDPVQTFGRAILDNSSNPQPISLVGRVPVKVNGEGGAINPGDRITLSSVPGVGAKATTSGMTVGIALEPFDPAVATSTVNLINVFVNVGFGAIDWNGNMVAAGAGTTTEMMSTAGDPNVEQLLASDQQGASLIAEGFQWVLDQFNNIGVVIKNGVVKATAFVADKIIAKKVVTEAFEMKDSATGETYCVRITNGEWNKFLGTCGDTAAGAEVQIPEDDSATQSSSSQTSSSNSQPQTVGGSTAETASSVGGNSSTSASETESNATSTPAAVEGTSSSSPSTVESSNSVSNVGEIKPEESVSNPTKPEANSESASTSPQSSELAPAEEPAPAANIATQTEPTVPSTEQELVSTTELEDDIIASSTSTTTASN